MSPSRLGHPAQDSLPNGARISALGHYVPSRIVGNAEVAELVGVEPDWITARTGIHERRVAAEDETVVDMAVQAAQKALANSGVDRAEVDTVIVATSTAATQMPSCAAQVAARLGLERPGAFDVNTACAGFCYALACADSLVRSGTGRTVLVIGSDKSSAWLDWHDRDTALLFGDGAGAAVVTVSDEPAIGPVVWGSIGEDSRLVTIDEEDLVLRQRGREVFRWATSLGPIAREACTRSGIDPSELRGFVPHQANLRIVNSLAKSLELDMDNTVVATDVVDFGNTIAATVPIALSRITERGELAPGSPVLLFGFGAGLAYAGQVVIL